MALIFSAVIVLNRKAYPASRSNEPILLDYRTRYTGSLPGICERHRNLRRARIHVVAVANCVIGPLNECLVNTVQIHLDLGRCGVARIRLAGNPLAILAFDEDLPEMGDVLLGAGDIDLERSRLAKGYVRGVLRRPVVEYVAFAVRVVSYPHANVPPPETVPPAAGSAVAVMTYSSSSKFATYSAFSVAVKLYGLFVLTTVSPLVQLAKWQPLAGVAVRVAEDVYWVLLGHVHSILELPWFLSDDLVVTAYWV